jgi:putative ABC transport system substrate-binding protein
VGAPDGAIARAGVSPVRHPQKRVHRRDAIMLMRPSPGPLRETASPSRRALLRAAVGGVVATSPLVLFAQQKSSAWTVGFLAPGSSAMHAYAGFRRGLREVGLVEGTNVRVQWRFADGRYDRLNALADELARLNVDVIVAGTTLGVQAARHASATIPIVMIAVPDPVGEGFAKSLPAPGGNITGLSSIVTEVSAKHVDLLRSAVPRLSRLAVLINPINPSDALILEQVQGAAYTRNISVVVVEASTAERIDAAFGEMTRSRVEALIVAADEFFDMQAERVVALAQKGRLPMISSNWEMTEAGGLMSYGQDLAEHYRRAATYVEKILRGAKPGGLPVEQPTVLQLTINRKTAKALGLAVPQELSLRADRLID